MTSMLTPQIELHDGVAVLQFGPGPHTIHEGDMVGLTDPMLEASNADPPRMVVDLSQVEFFGSSFIELLFRMWKRLNERSGQFALAGLSPYCDEVLAVTNLNKLWPSYETTEEAVEAIRSAA
ncbi:MAG: STAS domain-containing protein [Planctomycetaceae bacterium]